MSHTSWVIKIKLERLQLSGTKGVSMPAAGGQETEVNIENMGLFVGSLVCQLFGKALERIFVIGLSNLKATPITVYVWFCILQKTKRRFKKKQKQTILCLSFVAADFLCSSTWVEAVWGLFSFFLFFWTCWSYTFYSISVLFYRNKKIWGFLCL